MGDRPGPAPAPRGALEAVGTAAAVTGAGFRGDARRIARPRLVARLADRVLGSLGRVPGVGTVTRVGPGEWRVELNGQDVDVRVRSGRTGTDVARVTTDVAAGTVEVTLSDRARSRDVPRAIAHELAEAAAVLSGASSADVLTDGQLPAGELTADRLSAHDHGRLAELSHLAQQALAPGGTGLRQEAWIAAEAAALLRSTGLVEGVNDPATGTAVGGSPGFEARFAALPDRARADVLTLNELGGLAAVPEAVAGRFSTAVKIALGNVTPALLTQTPAVLGALLTGNTAGLLAPGIAGSAGVTGGVNAGLAERRFARLAARRKAAVENRLGLTAELRGAAGARQALVLAELAAAQETLTDVRDELRRAGATSSARLGAGVVGVVLGRIDAETGTSAAARTSPLAHGQVDGAPVDRPGAADRVPAGRSAWSRYGTGPVTTFVVGAAGLGIATLCGYDLSLLPVLTTGAAVLGSGLQALTQHRFGLHKAGRETARSAVEDARAEAMSRAQVELAALPEQAEVDQARQAVDAAARRARSLAEGVPAATTAAAPTPAGRGDLLVPGSTDGVLDPGDLTAADRARLAEITDLAQQLASAPRTGADAVAERLRAALAAAGLDGPVPLRSDGTAENDPDALGWPRRRVLLDPDLLTVVQSRDDTPSAVPGLGAHLAAAVVGTAVPTMGTGLVTAFGAGFGPLALLTIVGAPVAAALGQATGQWRAAQALETRKADKAAARVGLTGATEARLDELRAELRTRRHELSQQAAALERSTEALAARQALRTARADEQRRLAARPVLGQGADALLRPGDAVPPPLAAPVPRPVVAPPTSGAEPVPVPVGSPVYTPLRRMWGTYLPGPVVSAGTAYLVWHVQLGLRLGELLSPATWALAASTPTRSAATAVVSAFAAVLSGTAQAHAEHAAGRAAAEADERRKAAVKVRHARLAGPVEAAGTADLTRTLGEVTRELATARAELTELRERQERAADAAVPVRGPGVVPAAIGRVTAWLAGRRTAEVRTLVEAAPAGSPAQLAALSRLADQLPSASPAERRELLPVVAGQARRADLVGASASPQHAHATVPGPLGAVVAALGAAGGIATALTTTGTDEQFWRLMTALANATGWWPEEECECPAGTSCTCASPVADPAGPADPADPLGPADPADPAGLADPAGPAGPADVSPPATSVDRPDVAAPAGPSAAPAGPSAAPDAGSRPTAGPGPAVPSDEPATAGDRSGSTQVTTGAERSAGPGWRAAGGQQRAGGADQRVRTAPVPPEGRGTAVPTPVSGATGAAQPDVRVDVETWPDGGVTRSVLVVVRSPGGAEVTVLARWVDPGRGALPVLVLSDVPGPGMWWGVPVAVLQAVTAALAALSPTRTRTAEFLVLGHRPDGTATGELTQLPVGLVDGAPGVLTGRGPRRLPGDEAVQATGALRLRPVPDLLGRLRRVPTGG